MKKRWILQTKRGDFRGIGAKYGISPVTVRCMMNRGVSTEKDFDEYLNAAYDSISSPWLLKDMEQAVEIVVHNKDRMAAIASDFDCDGIFSAFILKKGFAACGIESRIFTPDRVAEGLSLIHI